MENKEIGVRKGAWTREEDLLLTKCIQQFGEGRWHLVPPRAGLNRCRKSCRMRWLNYLKPNIKRGNFEEDEVDLIKRMHKLLGNRWSLIAGRIPGRTANDVKNFWNTHICKKSSPSKMAAETSTCRSVVIKPMPRNLSMSRSAAATTSQPNDDDENVKNNNINIASSSSFNQQHQMCSASSSPLMVEHENVAWWRELLQMSQNGEDEMLPISSPPQAQGDHFLNGLFADLDMLG